jgi:hypothetical protein
MAETAAAAATASTAAWWAYLAWVGAALLLLVVGYEWARGRFAAEGFTDGAADAPAFFARRLPRRVDVGPAGPGSTGGEEAGWVRDPRFFNGYADVQGLGYAGDFCRVVQQPGNPGSRVFACALAGTEGLDSLSYRTGSQRGGTRFSRDDYMADVGDGKAAYCRVLKTAAAPSDAWAASCIRPGLTRFAPPAGSGTDSGAAGGAASASPVDAAGAPPDASEVADADPPAAVSDLLFMYEGLMLWYRLIDDVADYAGNTKAALAGGAGLNQAAPKHDPDGSCEGLALNAVTDATADPTKGTTDQFVRLGEAGSGAGGGMAFSDAVKPRDMRAFAFYVKFDAFTQNARVFDFGSGAGDGNVLISIEGTGNAGGGAGGGMAFSDAVKPRDMRAVRRRRGVRAAAARAVAAGVPAGAAAGAAGEPARRAAGAAGGAAARQPAAGRVGRAAAHHARARAERRAAGRVGARGGHGGRRGVAHAVVAGVRRRRAQVHAGQRPRAHGEPQHQQLPGPLQLGGGDGELRAARRALPRPPVRLPRVPHRHVGGQGAQDGAVGARVAAAARRRLARARRRRPADRRRAGARGRQRMTAPNLLG